MEEVKENAIKIFGGTASGAKRKAFAKECFLDVFEEKQGGQGGCKGVRKGENRK